MSVTGTAVPRVPEMGVIEVSVAFGGLTTVKVVAGGLTGLVLPGVVVTVTFLAVRPAPAVIVKVALIWVADTTVTPLTATPAPDTLTAVTPVNPVPVMVTGETLVPRAPDAGLTEVTVGPSTVNVTALLVPPGVTTVTFLAVAAAPAVIVNVVVSWVPAAFTVRVPALTPAPDTFTAVAPVRLVPVRVTATLLLRWPELGAIEVSVGAGGGIIVNVTALLVTPPAMATVTFLAVAFAPMAMVNVAVIVESFTTVNALVPTPAPDTLTPVAPVKPAPEMVTGTAVPAWPLLGVIEFSPMPLPVRLTVSVSPGFVVTESVPGCGPVAVGANRTLKVQLAPPARVVPAAQLVSGPRLY